MPLDPTAYSATLQPPRYSEPGDIVIKRRLPQADVFEEVVLRPINGGFIAFDALSGQLATFTEAEFRTALGVAASTNLFGRAAQSNASGNTTLTISANTRQHTEIITVSGSGRTSEIIIPVADRTDGDIVTIRFVNTVNGVTLNIRNATVGGTVINTCPSTDGNAVFQFYFDGTAFQPLFNIQSVI